MQELRKGLWHWRARHPEWEEGEPWDRNVSSYAIDNGEQLALFDPLGVPYALRSARRWNCARSSSPAAPQPRLPFGIAGRKCS